MSRFLLSLVAVLTALFAVGCASPEPDYGSARRYVPRVLMPTNLNNWEEQFIDEVGDALGDAGYRPTVSRGAEYELRFSVAVGPVNADVHLELVRDGETVAKSFARSGGLTTMFKRQRVVREAFDKALADFESQVPRGGSRGGSGGGGYDSGEWRSSGSGSSSRESRAPRSYDDAYSSDAERGSPYEDVR